jgi:hypothetical protein
MKKRLTVLILCLLLAFVVPAISGPAPKTLTFQWEQPLPLDDLAGWRLYYGTASGVYDKSIVFDYTGTPSDTYTRDTVIISETGQEITYYFVLTAFDSSGNESGFSNEVIAKIDFLAPGVPTNLRVIIKVQ